MRHLLISSMTLLLAGCLSRAWEDDGPASRLERTTSAPPAKPRTGGGLGYFTGGQGAGGGMGAGGGAGGFGGSPMGGGGPRPLVPIVIGSFTGGSLPGPLFPRGPLRSTTLATVPNTRELVAVVDDVDALFVLGVPNRRLSLPAGSRPSSVAVSPDGSIAWVALRGLGSVARVRLSTGAFFILPVGAEPTGIALSPSGRLAVVATFGERTVSLIDTQLLSFTAIDVGGNPRALTITNDGDADDSDESAWVTLFFGELLSEGSNTGRHGVVVELNLGSRSVAGRVTLSPINTGRMLDLCVPNQLHAIAEQSGRMYVSHVCAGPAAPQGPLDSVYAGLSVFDRTTRNEDRTVNGSRLLRTMSFFPSLMSNPVDVAPLPGGSVVVLSQGGNEVHELGTLFSVRAGLSPFYDPIMGPFAEDPAAGVPIGVLALSPQLIFVLDATGRRVLELNDLTPMGRTTAWPFQTLPPEGSPAHVELLGRRHFATAEGLWSLQNSVACTSCHPDGLTDNLTWMFPGGPRQTPSLVGTFERGLLSAHRAQGWTATSDEISDVEHIVRTLAGGKGAITSAFDPNVVVPLDNGFNEPNGLARHDGLSASSRQLVAATSKRDWIELEAWIAALPRPPASPRLDPLSVTRGRELFRRAGCAACHGGAQWTVSRVPYEPSFEKNGSAVGSMGVPAVPTGLRTQPRAPGVLWNPQLNTDTFKVALEQVVIGGQIVTIGPERITCVLRDVGTFNRSDPIEVKSNGDPAQGERGFNPPSLLGLATSAPYLHHGKARTLTELFTAPFAPHHQAGLSGFLAAADGGVEVAQVADLVAFLESIDEETPTFGQPFGTDLCGAY